MRETLLANCEKSFIEKAILEGLRLDGRTPDEFRKIRIHLGTEYGSAYVCLGETRVLANVSCQITQPKSVRPQEGLLFINVELGPMAAPHFEASRSSDASVQLNRILERVLKDSRCLDLESLCIVAEEKVWSLRIDVNILNYEGNAVDCASIACLAALSHFRRPDVTSTGEEVIVHTAAEKDLIPMVMLHYPVCVSFGIFNSGKLAVADPSTIEEKVSEANIVFGINSYKELCGLHLGGTTLTNPQLLLRCADKGAKRAKTVVEHVKEVLNKDADARAKGEIPSFSDVISSDALTTMNAKSLPIQLRKFKLQLAKDEPMDTSDDMEDSKIHLIAAKSGILLPKTKNGTEWVADDDNSESSEDEVMILDAKNVPINLESD